MITIRLCSKLHAEWTKSFETLIEIYKGELSHAVTCSSICYCFGLPRQINISNPPPGKVFFYLSLSGQACGAPTEIRIDKLSEKDCTEES